MAGRALPRPLRRRGMIAAAAAVFAALATPAPSPAAGGATSYWQPGHSTAWAFVNAPVTARAAPRRSARALGRLTTRTQDRTDELVLVLGARAAGGQDWFHVSLPLRPAGVTGWVPAWALSELRFTSTWVVVDRRRLLLKVVRDGRTILRRRVGIGQPEWPTPAGRFYVRDRIVPRDRGGMYGPLAFGLSARSEVLTDWPGGGFIGIHGTNRPGLLPGRVSHGCVRLRNRDVLALGKLIAPGVPVTVR
jgi:lipoprotein-anchoring transpeptidase ErfK/SrfK